MKKGQRRRERQDAWERKREPLPFEQPVKEQG